VKNFSNSWQFCVAETPDVAYSLCRPDESPRTEEPNVWTLERLDDRLTPSAPLAQLLAVPPASAEPLSQFLAGAPGPTPAPIAAYTHPVHPCSGAEVLLFPPTVGGDPADALHHHR
jgi:hypothetical protein